MALISDCFTSSITIANSRRSYRKSFCVINLNKRQYLTSVKTKSESLSSSQVTTRRGYNNAKVSFLGLRLIMSLEFSSEWRAIPFL